MSIESVVDNDLFYEPEDGYWDGHDKLSFEAATLVDEWPAPTNPFVRRMANIGITDRGLHGIALGDFQQVVGALIEADPSAGYRFLVVPQSKDARAVSITLVSKVCQVSPPLRADNIGSMAMAFEWMSRRVGGFEVSCAAGGTYWIHRR